MHDIRKLFIYQDCNPLESRLGFKRMIYAILINIPLLLLGGNCLFEGNNIQKFTIRMPNKFCVSGKSAVNHHSPLQPISKDKWGTDGTVFYGVDFRVQC